MHQDISKVAVSGLETAHYLDKTASSKDHQDPSSKPVSFTAETDRVYSSPATQALSITEDSKPKYEIIRDMLGDVVVWNPWDKKAGSMADFGPEGAWKKMVCVETGSVSDWNKLETGDTWEGGQRIRVL